MHIIITHDSPDWDAIGSVWIIKRFLPGWENAKVEFVPAGERSPRVANKVKEADEKIIVEVKEDKILHMDTGFTPLDHHQDKDTSVCSTSKAWQYVLEENKDLHGGVEQTKKDGKVEAIGRVVDYIVELDHFKEVFWPDAASNIHEFSLYGILDGMKGLHPSQSDYYVSWGMEILDAMVRRFESRIWAEREIAKGRAFETKWGKGLGIESINDSVIKLAQKTGYSVVVRRDPRKGYVRIKALPYKEGVTKDINLTLAAEQLRKMDPEATWFLHVSNKMLLNGTPKNPKMVPTKLSLDEIIRVLEKI
ncbi:MAG TPA: DHH family phosphoesterase [Candidatus Saccharimonadales bacterium]|nr:DHH family phosphoesterase [Candidatus Saccharimonadales bacterium]